MARPRKPKAVKHLQGTYRNNQEPIKDSVSVPSISMPRPPEMLAEKMTDRALKIWGVVEPVLSAAKLLTNGNMFQLVRYCILMDDWLDHAENITLIRNGEDRSEWRNARLKERVYLRGKSHEELMALDKVFGISPLFQDGIEARVAKEVDELEDMIT